MSRRPTNPPPLRSIDRVLSVGGKQRKTTTGTANSSSSNDRRTDTDNNRSPEQMPPTENRGWAEWEEYKKRKREEAIPGAGNAQSLVRMRAQDDTEAKQKAEQIVIEREKRAQAETEAMEMEKKREIEREQLAQDEKKYRHQKFGDHQNYEDFLRWKRNYKR